VLMGGVHISPAHLFFSLFFSLVSLWLFLFMSSGGFRTWLLVKKSWSPHDRYFAICASFAFLRARLSISAGPFFHFLFWLSPVWTLFRMCFSPFEKFLQPVSIFNFPRDTILYAFLTPPPLNVGVIMLRRFLPCCPPHPFFCSKNAPPSLDFFLPFFFQRPP